MPSELEEATAEIESRHFLRPFRTEPSYAILRDGTDFKGLDANGLPIPPHPLWIGYGKTSEDYLASGERHLSTMLMAVKKTGFSPLAPGSRLLDFGCGAGRMLRHLAPHATESEIWGCDLSADHIVWAQQYLSPPFRFITNTTFPHLPFVDGKFSFIYAGSVFSHIDDLADAWLCELRRILQKEGRLLISIHDENTVEMLERINHRLADQVKENELYKKTKDSFAKLVIDRGTWSQVFYHTSSFIRMVECLGFKVLHIEPRAYGYQTGVVLAPAD